MTEWEYHVAIAGIGGSEIEDECNQAGEQEWELVNVIVVEATPGEWRTRLIFKRPKEEELPRPERHGR